MAAVKVTQYQNLDEVKDDDLREEAEGWQTVTKSNIVCGTAILTPDDGSGPMEGFFDRDQGQGMVVWGDSLSDWIAAHDLHSMFRAYVQNM